MKAPVLLILFVLFSLSRATSYAGEGSSWDDYVQRTFQSVIDQHVESARGTDFLFTGDNFPSRVVVIYTGQKRALPEKRAEFLAKYFAKFRHEPQLAKLFKSEILVREGRNELWLPIQESLLPSLATEVNSGNQVTVLTTWLGAFRQGERVEWVFTINEFEASSGE